MNDITPEWLTRALRIGGSLDSAIVKSLEFKPIGEGQGFVGEVARVSVDYSGEAETAPGSLVAKIAIANDEVRDFAVRTGMYERETRVYTDLRDDFGIRIPGLYYGDSDPEAGYFVLLLEDLSHLRVGDETNVGSIEDARAAVRNAAQLHAHWWNSDQLHLISSSSAWLDRPLDPAYAQTRQSTYEFAWNKVAGQLKNALPPAVYELGERLGPGLAQLWSNATPSALTLNHGDYRLANLFFDRNEVIAFDWQYALHGPPAFDLADFLVWSMTVDQRRTHEASLIDLYVKTLAEHGVKNYTRDQALQDCRLGMLRNLETYVTSIPNLAMSSEAGQAWVDAVSPRMIALSDWECGALIPK